MLNSKIALKLWPREIIEQAAVHYWDIQTLHWIAIGKRQYQEKERDFMVSFDKRGDAIEVISISPLKKGQKQSRIRSGRWVVK